MKPESVKLYFKEGSSDKEYNAYLEKDSMSMGWKVRFAYGRRGNAGNSGSKTPFPIEYDKAKKIYDKLVYAKMAKGYTEDKKGVPFLSADEDKKPTGWVPQLLNPIDEEEVQKYIDSDGWCAQEKYDGHNRLLIKQDDLITGSNRKGLAVPILGDVMKELMTLPDGVIASEDMGDCVRAFDAIHMKASYKLRIKTVESLLDGFSYIRPIYTAYERRDKQQLYRRLKKQNAEGIVFKQLDAYYTPGRPESGGSQLKFKFVETASVMVWKVNKTKRSIAVAVFDDKGGNMTNVGNVTVYPNQSIPQVDDIVEVKYLYYFKNGSLYQPVLLGDKDGNCKRDDIEPADCKLSKLKLKREG